MEYKDVIGVIAAWANVFGLYLALRIALTWKNQHNYSFERDKIFELELATDQLFKEAIYYIITIRDVITARIQGNLDQDFFKDELKIRLTNLQACLKQYDLKLSSLSVLGIDYNKEILESADRVNQYFDDVVDKMYAESKPEKALDDFEKIYLLQANVARDMVLKHLKEIRKKI